jgi:hypothetical protein
MALRLVGNLNAMTTISSADIPTFAVFSTGFLIYRIAMVFGLLKTMARVLHVKNTHKFVHRTFDLIHYCVASITGILALRSRPYGHCFAYAHNCLDLFYQNPDGFVVTIFEKLYFMLFSCYYAVDFMFICTSSEPFVLALHHVLTLSEVACCVILQAPAVGLSIMLLHDVSDVPLYVGKFLIYLGLNTVAQGFLGIFVLGMTYFRIYNYPIIVYRVYQMGWNTDLHQTLMRFQTVCLVLLYGMHWMWEVKIFGVVSRAIRGGEVRDTRSD